MNVSPARLAANRANALKSTGPRTPEGKERSRANAFKHGMAGEGVALPVEDEAEVKRVFARLGEELAPEGEIAVALVRRVALLLLRLDRSAVQDSAHLSGRVRSAGSDFDEARQAEVDRLMGAIDEEPAAGVRQLRRIPEGVDRLVATWLAIKADVLCKVEERWTAGHRRMAENLCGRRPGDFGITRVEALARAIRGDFAHLGPLDGEGLDDRGRMAWARERMGELIDAEVARLLDHRETLDLDAIAADRARAADRALFDPSHEATLARRYEAAAERGLFRALRELRQGHVAGFAPAIPEPEPASAALRRSLAEAENALAQAGRLGSFRAPSPDDLPTAPVGPIRRAEPARDPSREHRPCRNAPRDASTVVVGRG